LGEWGAWRKDQNADEYKAGKVGDKTKKNEEKSFPIIRYRIGNKNIWLY